MIRNEKYSVSRSPEIPRGTRYKALSVALGYPNEALVSWFPQWADELEELQREYDRLFRAENLLLYSGEYTAKSDFQSTNALADIEGFYAAFGVECELERADALTNELEFMHLLIFKEEYALREGLPEATEKAAICRDAQRAFFLDHLYPAAQAVGRQIALRSANSFYTTTAHELLQFLTQERELLEARHENV
ncbi:MAG: molecular chaperone TorD family protein [Myxococcales bacterium]|nr:molecular chaperone TorD family protein [Myxococcales bacterium]